MPVFVKSSKAEEDLIDIWLYIAQDNPTAADELLERFEGTGWLLAENPELGQARPDIAPDFRYFPVERYLMLYRKIPEGIQLVRVVHGAKSLLEL